MVIFFPKNVCLNLEGFTVPQGHINYMLGEKISKKQLQEEASKGLNFPNFDVDELPDSGVSCTTAFCGGPDCPRNDRISLRLLLTIEELLDENNYVLDKDNQVLKFVKA